MGWQLGLLRCSKRSSAFAVGGCGNIHFHIAIVNDPKILFSIVPTLVMKRCGKHCKTALRRFFAVQSKCLEALHQTFLEGFALSIHEHVILLTGSWPASLTCDIIDIQTLCVGTTFAPRSPRTQRQASIHQINIVSSNSSPSAAKTKVRE